MLHLSHTVDITLEANDIQIWLQHLGTFKVKCFHWLQLLIVKPPKAVALHRGMDNAFSDLILEWLACFCQTFIAFDGRSY